MTADNLTFALEIDFIPDLQEGRDDFKKKMKSVAEKIDGSYTLDQKSPSYYFRTHKRRY